MHKFKHIKPVEPPKLKQPSDDPSGDGVFRLDGEELFLHDLYAQEPIRGSGTACELFVRDFANSKVDPLYNEPIETAWLGPYKLYAHVEWPEFTPEPSEDGFRAIWPSGVWIPRKSVEETGSRPPREGDIIRFWKLPYFDNRASGSISGTQRPGFYFSLIKVADDGHLHDDAAFVGFRCDLKRLSNAPPEAMFHEAKDEDDDC